MVNTGEGLADVPILAWGGYQDTVGLGADDHWRERRALHVTHPASGVQRKSSCHERVAGSSPVVERAGER